MTEHPSAGDTVMKTKTRPTKKPGAEIPRNIECHILVRAESTPAARKRHLDATTSPKTEVVPAKSPRRGEPLPYAEPEAATSMDRAGARVIEPRVPKSCEPVAALESTATRTDLDRNAKTPSPSSFSRKRIHPRSSVASTNLDEGSEEAKFFRQKIDDDSRRKVEVESTNKTENHAEHSRVDETENRSRVDDNEATRRTEKSAKNEAENALLARFNRAPISKRDDSVKLRKTIQWLEEGARRMREDLASTRAELHEERRAARLARREIDSAVRDAKNNEASKHLRVISELKSRLAQSPTRPTTTDSGSSKTELLKEENHRRELSALRKRLSEAESTIQKMKAKSQGCRTDGSRRKIQGSDGRKMELEVQALRAANKKLEDRLQVVTEAERSRAAELRAQHENHEAQLTAMQKTLRSDTIKMMDEIRSKAREIEKLEKLVLEGSQMQRKLQTKEDDLMRKLRESERTHQIRLAPRIDEKITNNRDNHSDEACHGDCDASAEVEKLRELNLEQQEVIEVLRQAVKEKERKLDQLSNKRRKEEFYKQWLELEPVVEVDDEDDHEEGDSALSSAPSSLSPQPGVCGQFQNPGITREAYETVLIEVEELQARLVEEQRELAHAKSQVRELEKALLQETRGSQNSRRALSDKLREAEDRETILVAELSELREQNELLEFRVLELEETQCLRDTPDPADSGIVSPEPIHLYKEQIAKPRDRAVATVIPYNTYNNAVSPIPRKPPLSLQESGIFDEDEDEDDEETGLELASRGTQTETPAGDLLQEVQRLHELRARIQERAVKVPLPVIDAARCSAGCNDVVAATDLDQRERVRELEARLAGHAEAEKQRLREKEISKQREEELLDENYRLTERIHAMENALRNQKNRTNEESRNLTGEPEIRTATSGLEGVVPAESSAGNGTENVDGDGDVAMEEEEEADIGDTKVRELLESPVTLDENDERMLLSVEGEKTDLTTRLKRLVSGIPEFRTREKIADSSEVSYAATLRQANESWAKIESSYAVRLEEFRGKLDVERSTNEKLTAELAKIKTRLKSIEKCAVCGKDPFTARDAVPRRGRDAGLDVPEKSVDGSPPVPMEVDGNPEQQVRTEVEEPKRRSSVPDAGSPVSCSSYTNQAAECLTAELALEAKEEEVDDGEEENPAGDVLERIEVRGNGEEVDGVNEVDAEPVVTISVTKETEKKVSERLAERVSGRDEGWAMKVWRSSKRAESLERLKDYFFGQRVCKLVLYDEEFCV